MQQLCLSCFQNFGQNVGFLTPTHFPTWSDNSVVAKLNKKQEIDAQSMIPDMLSTVNIYINNTDTSKIKFSKTHKKS